MIRRQSLDSGRVITRFYFRRPDGFGKCIKVDHIPAINDSNPDSAVVNSYLEHWQIEIQATEAFAYISGRGASRKEAFKDLRKQINDYYKLLETFKVNGTKRT